MLSQYFISVGCQPNLAVAMYSVDSLRQLAMKFLERDELANYTFQNDFMRPFVVVMRQSQVSGGRRRGRGWGRSLQPGSVHQSHVMGAVLALEPLLLLSQNVLCTAGRAGPNVLPLSTWTEAVTRNASSTERGQSPGFWFGAAYLVCSLRCLARMRVSWLCHCVAAVLVALPAAGY